MPVLTIPASYERGQSSAIGFPTILSGALVTGYTWGVTSTVQRSLDGAAFSTSTNSPSPIAASSGAHYLTLTAAECSANLVIIKITDSGSAFDPIIITAYPQRSAFLSNLVQLLLARLR